MKTLARIALIAIVAACFVELTGIYAELRPRSLHPQWERTRERRPPEPHLYRLPSFLGELVVVALIAIAGRKILRLKLIDSRLP